MWFSPEVPLYLGYLNWIIDAFVSMQQEYHFSRYFYDDPNLQEHDFENIIGNFLF